MKKSVAVILFFTGLVAFTQAEQLVNVGGANGENIFEPQAVTAMPGENIKFVWRSGKHSVLESDEPKACAKSKKADAFASGGAIATDPKTPNVLNVKAPAAGKTWFYCGVPGHCEGGMYGSITIMDGSAPPAGGANSTAGMPGMPGGSTPTDAAGAAPSAKSTGARTYSSFAAGVVLSSMCMAAAYVL